MKRIKNKNIMFIAQYLFYNFLLQKFSQIAHKSAKQKFD